MSDPRYRRVLITIAPHTLDNGIDKILRTEMASKGMRTILREQTLTLDSAFSPSAPLTNNAKPHMRRAKDDHLIAVVTMET